MLVLRAASALLSPIAKLLGRRRGWVVGLEEIAGMVDHLSRALSPATSVVYRRHAFYDAPVDIVLGEGTGLLGSLRRRFGGPLALAWYANRAEGIVYVGRPGFLPHEHDQRAWEFSFVQSRGAHVVCYFTGNDIRSPRRMAELAERTGRPNLGTLLAELDPVFTTDDYDRERRVRAEVADRYASAVFNAEVDQASYLVRPTLPFRYFYPDEGFRRNEAKFERVDRPVVVHAPSNPVLKGTSHVRAAVEQLRAEGYAFDYREVSGVSNTDVIAALDEAHIALNQFHAYMPGVFGIEAMARTCAVLMSADPDVETDLGADAARAWVVTYPEQIADHLRELLDDPSRLREQAIRGYEWAVANASATASASAIRSAVARLD